MIVSLCYVGETLREISRKLSRASFESFATRISQLIIGVKVGKEISLFIKFPLSIRNESRDCSEVTKRDFADESIKERCGISGILSEVFQRRGFSGRFQR